MCRQAQVPRCRDRRTAKHIGQYTGHIVAHGDENDRPHGQSEAVTRKDAQVENADGDFGEPCPGAVDDGRDDVEL